MEAITTTYITKGAGRSYNEESISTNQKFSWKGSMFMKNLKMSRLTWALRWKASGQFKGLK